MLTLAISPHPQTLVKVARKIGEDKEVVLRILSEVFGLGSPVDTGPTGYPSRKGEDLV